VGGEDGLHPLERRFVLRRQVTVSASPSALMVAVAAGKRTMPLSSSPGSK
jgi:hypothetical protein